MFRICFISNECKSKVNVQLRDRKERKKKFLARLRGNYYHFATFGLTFGGISEQLPAHLSSDLVFCQQGIWYKHEALLL